MGYNLLHGAFAVGAALSPVALVACTVNNLKGWRVMSAGIAVLVVYLRMGLPAENIPELLAACDAAFLSFQDAELWTMIIPAKLQSYMACGMPVIVSAACETERIIDEA